MLTLYREKVTELHAALAEPDLRAEALELIRGLIARVELFPAAEGYRIELFGENCQHAAALRGRGGSGDGGGEDFGKGGCGDRI